MKPDVVIERERLEVPPAKTLQSYQSTLYIVY